MLIIQEYNKRGSDINPNLISECINQLSLKFNKHKYEIEEELLRYLLTNNTIGVKPFPSNTKDEWIEKDKNLSFLNIFTSRARSPNSIRVCSFDVRNWNNPKEGNLNVDECIKIIKLIDADILCLQEVSFSGENEDFVSDGLRHKYINILKEIKNLGYKFSNNCKSYNYPETNAYFGNIVASKYPIKYVSSEYISSDSTTQCYTLSDVLVDTNKIVRIISIQFDLLNLSQLHKFLESIDDKKLSLIICGEFNILLDKTDISKKIKTEMDEMEKSGFLEVFSGKDLDQTTMSGKKSDHIWFKGNDFFMECVSSNVYYTSNFYHYPLVSDFLLSGEKTNKSTPSTLIDFVDTDYDITKDDQKHLIIIEEEHKTRKIDYQYRFPKFDINSRIPKEYRGLNLFQLNSTIMSNLKENFNWSNRTLSYARSSTIGKYIVNCIVKPLLQKLNIKTIEVVDATAGIGGDTLVFAMESFISKIYSYEKDAGARLALSRNVNVYGFGDVVEINPIFKFCIPDGSLVIIDPPYEIANNKDNFNLSIEAFPIYEVAQRCLDGGALIVMLTMPVDFKYNKKYAIDHRQHVTAYTMGNKNNKIFIVMNQIDAINIGKNFGEFKVVMTSLDGYQDKPFVCKTEIKTDSGTYPLISKPIKIVRDNVFLGLTKKITGDFSKGKDIDAMLESYQGRKKGKSLFASDISRDNSRYNEIIKHIPQFDKIVYLDIGGGDGENSKLLCHLLKSKSKDISCFDSDIKDLRNLYFTSKFELIEPNKELSFKNSSITIISSLHSVHHMSDALFRLKDISRMLIPGGILILRDHNVESQHDSNIVNFEHFVYSIGEGTVSIDDVARYDKILPMYFFSSAYLRNYIKNLGFDELYYHEDEKKLRNGKVAKRETKTYWAIFKRHGASKVV